MPQFSDEITAFGKERGRIVMLVDNQVNGDSRVQKAARSAADRGWEVTLLGRSNSAVPAQTWQLGKAEVRLLEFHDVLHKHPEQFRRLFWRHPLAYPPGHIASYRRREVRARQAELRFRGSLLGVRKNAGDTGPGFQFGRVRLKLARIAAELRRRWVRMRVRQTKAVSSMRRNNSTTTDRVAVRFWSKLMGDRAWRRIDPSLWEFEFAYAKAIDALKPDIIHANDFRMLGVGARAALRARSCGRDVKLVWDAHEFLPGICSWSRNERWKPAMMAAEREFARYADRVVTVSDGLADLLQETHGLKEKPAVVLNAPEKEIPEEREDIPLPDLRKQCGIGPEVPLLVYSGAAAPQRGLDTMIEALPHLPGTHVALIVARPECDHVQELLGRAAELGAVERVHALPYVPHWQVVPYLAAADVGVIPIRHFPNHEIALITKYFEYSHARLPVVVSDVRTMAATTRSTGQGEVFEAENTEDYVRAVRSILDDPQRYRSVYERPGLLDQWYWETQADILDGIYLELNGRPAPEPVRADQDDEDPAPDPVEVPA
ncbi:glycosyltransferase family 4 protein [Phytomonospora sp. NPDC050363]|uniref:glycosyltransferase family 4 protein n=1 Tax=Phytomonospora sp. NPDC050363 TaxID=3155642 RepID=UPI0033F11E3A